MYGIALEKAIYDWENVFPTCPIDIMVNGVTQNTQFRIYNMAQFEGELQSFLESTVYGITMHYTTSGLDCHSTDGTTLVSNYNYTEIYISEYQLIITGNNNLNSVSAVMAHELGHAFGLTHRLSSTCIMYPEMSSIEVDKPKLTDYMHIFHLYL